MKSEKLSKDDIILHNFLLNPFEEYPIWVLFSYKKESLSVHANMDCENKMFNIIVDETSLRSLSFDKHKIPFTNELGSKIKYAIINHIYDRDESFGQNVRAEITKTANECMFRCSYKRKMKKMIALEYLYKILSKD